MVDDALRLALEALVDAADQDVGTGGPDIARGIYPSVKIVTQDGITEVGEAELQPMSAELLMELKG